MKWEDRDSVQKSFSIRFTVILIAGIIICIYKNYKNLIKNSNRSDISTTRAQIVRICPPC